VSPGWRALESWGGSARSSAGWASVEGWTGTAGTVGAWSRLESWVGTIGTQPLWQSLESLAGVVRTLPSWQLLETWSGMGRAYAGWTAVESWSEMVQTLAAWASLDSWVGTGEARAGWSVAESWTGTVEAPSGWTILEGWAELGRATAVWQQVEGWAGTVGSPAGWLSLETFSGDVGSYAGWRATESLMGSLQTVPGWEITEGWIGSIRAPAGWVTLETRAGGISSPAAWRPLDSFISALRSPASWSRAEDWSCTCCAPVPAPVLVSPAEGEWVSDNTPLLVWDNLLPADNYDLQIDNDADFSSPIYTQTGLLTTSHEVQIELPSGNYYWRVRQWRSGENSAWSSSWFRVVLLPGAPVLLSPENTSWVRRNVTFVWIPGANADNHRIEIDNNDNFEDGVVENVLLGAIDNTYSTVLDYGTFWWRVWAINPIGETVSENVWCLTVYAAWDSLESWSVQTTASAGWRPVETLAGMVTAQASWSGVEVMGASCAGTAGWRVIESLTSAVRTLGAPVLLSPENDSWLNDNTPTLDWQDVPGALEYLILVDNDLDFNTPVLGLFVQANEYTFTFELENGTYYWKARAKAGELLSPWSAVWQFTVGYDVTPPTEPVPLTPENGSTLYLSDGRPTFTWLTSLDEESDRVVYTLEVSRFENFSELVYLRSGLTENYHQVENLLPEDNYWWRVRARDWAGNENVSRAFLLRLKVPPVSSVLPISPYWRSTSPIIIQVSASDADGSVTKVELWYRWSSDNSGWGSWILYDYDTVPPYQFSFYPPSGEGYYEFYSRARDNSGNYESAPAVADACCGYDYTVPYAPTLISPENNVSLVDSTGRPTFRWSSVTDLSGITYILQIDNDSDFLSPAYELELTENLHQVENVLRQDNYWWRVKVRNGAGLENVSASFRFELIVPPVSSVLPISPYWRSTSPIIIQVSASDADGSVTKVELWYRWSSDNSGWGSWILYDYDTVPPYQFSFYPPSGEGYYEFYSRARDNSGNYESAPTEPDAGCGYDCTSPPTPSLISPENGAGVDHWPFLSWTSVTDMSGVTYELEIDNEPSFQAPDYKKVGLTENWHKVGNSLEAGTYYWRVRAVDGAGNVGSWSENRSFIVLRGWLVLDSFTCEVRAKATWAILESRSFWTGVKGEWMLLEETSCSLLSPSIGFSLSLSPSAAEVTQGGSASTTICVNKLYSWYFRTVFLSVQNLPPNTTFTLSVQGAAPSYSSILTISTSSLTSPGVYLISILATDEVATATCTFQLEVKAPAVPAPPAPAPPPPPPPPPVKYPPTSNVRPILPFWNSSLPVRVEAEASDVDGTVVAVRLCYRHSMDNLRWSDWRVYGEDNEAPWSWEFSPPEKEGYYELYSIAVDDDGLVENAPDVPDVSLGIDLTPPATPTPLSPAENSPVPAKVRLIWSQVADLSGVLYEVEVDKSPSFDSSFLHLTTTESSLEFECPSEGRVFWRVRAVNGAGLRSAWRVASFNCVLVRPVEKKVPYLPALEPVKLDLTPMQPLFLRKVTLTFTSPLENLTVFVYEFRKAEFAEKFKVLPEYEYVAWVSLNVPAALTWRTEVEFQVLRSWLKERNLHENTVVLLLLRGGKWENLPAKLVGSDEVFFYYTASFSGFCDLLSVAAFKAIAPPLPTLPPAPRPTPPYIFYALLTILGTVGVGFAYFLYQRRLVIRPAISVERIARPSLPSLIRPTVEPAVPLEKLGPRPMPEVISIPPKLAPLKVKQIVPKEFPSFREALEGIKRVGIKPAVSLEEMAKIARPLISPVVKLEELAKAVEPLKVREVKKAIQQPSEVLRKLKEVSERA